MASAQVKVTAPSDPNLPNYHHPSLIKYLRRLQLVEDLLEGTERMQDQAKERGYIYKWKKEDIEVYKIRSRCEPVFGGLRRVLSAVVGMLFARPPQVDWGTSEAAWEDFWDDVDSAKSSGPVFIKRFVEGATQEGLALLTVDHPKAPVGADGEPLPTTSANEDQFNLRPHWNWYSRRQVVHWRTGKVNNVQQITALGLWEPSELAAGEYGVQEIDRYRTITLNDDGEAEWVLWEQKPDTEGKALTDFDDVDRGKFQNAKGEVATFLPVAVAHTGKTDSTLVASIPLMDVAWANLGHWRESTDLRFYKAVASFGQPYVIGDLPQETNKHGDLVDGTLALGPLVYVQIEAGGEFGWAGPSAETFKPLENGVEKKEEHMAVLGMSFIARQKRTQETAAARRLDAVAENSSLATVAQGIDDAINTLFEHTAWFRGEDPDSAPVFELNRDFEATSLDPETMLVYVQAVEKAGFPVRLLLEQWKQGGRLPKDADLDDIEMEMMTAIAAKEAEMAGPQ